jgi:transposase, IS30 family
MAYGHITLSERALIDHYREKRFSLRQIGRELGRSASTISREIRRNSKPGRPYHMSTAKHMAARRRSCQVRLKIPRCEALQKIVDKGLRAGWSPEQIAGRMASQDTATRISPGAIYRYVYRLKKVQPKKAARFKRCPAKYRKKPGCAFGPLGKKHMSQRPDIANLRGETGHWEGDTIVTSPGNPVLLVYVDRKTRYLIVRKVDSGKSEEITRQTIRGLLSAGKRNRKTITLDNGSEFAGYRDFERRLKMPTYFCKPRSPWERPTVENTNGLIRQLTRKKDLRKLDQKQVDELVKLLNDRPRKCLNWRTPAEEFS